MKNIICFIPGGLDKLHEGQKKHIWRPYEHFRILSEIGVYSRDPGGNKEEAINALYKEHCVARVYRLPDNPEESALSVSEKGYACFCIGIEGMENVFETSLMKFILNDYFYLYENTISAIDVIREHSSNYHSIMNKLRIKYGNNIPPKELQKATKWLTLKNGQDIEEFYPVIYIDGDKIFCPYNKYPEQFVDKPTLLITELERTLIRLNQVDEQFYPEEIIIRGTEVGTALRMISDADGMDVFARLKENEINSWFYENYFDEEFKVRGGSGYGSDDDFVNVLHIELERDNDKKILVPFNVVERIPDQVIPKA